MSTASVAAPVGDTLNQAWKNDKSKFGLKMLQKMGWTEGKGLGKHEDGVSEHVKVAKKSNNLGLGATYDSSGAAGWASAAVSFNGVLEALGKAYGGSGDAEKKKADKKMKKKAKKAEKKRRAKGGEDADESSSSSSSSGEGVSAAGSSVGAAKAASSCPSRARRVRSKDVKGFSQADLRAILGQAATTANPSLPSYPVVRSGYGAVPAAESEASTKKTKKKKKQPASPSLDSPHRPRTRSMDETVAAEPVDVVAGKRPRSGSFDGGNEAGGEGGPARGSRSSAAPRKSKKKKRGSAGEEEDAAEAEGGEVPAVAATRSKDKKRQKKSKEKVR